MAGGHKHKWTKLLDKDYFGKHGFTPIVKHEEKTANLITVSMLAEKSENNLVNLSEAGYTKLLGGGKITTPLTIVVEKWSKNAEEKVKQAGGNIVRPAELVQS